jgi:hypothetical protein
LKDLCNVVLVFCLLEVALGKDHLDYTKKNLTYFSLQFYMLLCLVLLALLVI